MSAPGSERAALEPLWLLLADCQRALEEEIHAVKSELARRGLDAPITALSGSARGEAGVGYRYLFQLPRGMYDIRVEDRVRVRSAGRESLGLVLEVDRARSTVQALVPDWRGERLPAPELEFDPTWLLRELSDRLDEIAEDPAAFHPDTVLGLFGRRPPALDRRRPTLASSGDLNEPQSIALERLLGSDTQLVWGPPGTGKSRLVARAALELGREGRVLVTAHTNGAVDEIAGRIASIADPEAVRAHRIVRVGSELGASSLPELTLERAVAHRVEMGAGGIRQTLEGLERDYRLGSAVTNGASPPPHARVNRLLALARERGDPEVSRTLGRVLLEVGRQSVRALEDAEVVLTTLARLAVREELRTLRFDSLLLDEASTAPLPYVALAAALAARRAVAVGDFQQLPPVVSSEGPAATRWLRTDVFRETGVVTDETGGFRLPSPRDRLCAMLDVQYRMDPDIRALVSDFFYDGRLGDASEVLERPRARSPLLLLDTSELGPVVERVDGSRRNPVHAEVVSAFLERATAAGESDIAIVTPYRAQTRHLRDLVRGRLGRTAPAGLQMSTIHRFQGREKRIVIIDTVDAPPGRSWFLDERRNADLPRLLNVALSRAREMLVVVASVEGLGRTLPPQALLRRILVRLSERGSHVRAADLVGSSTAPRGRKAGLWPPE